MKLHLPNPESTVVARLFDPPVRDTGKTDRPVRVRLSGGEIVDAVEPGVPMETDEEFAARRAHYEERKDITITVRLLKQSEVRALANRSRVVRQDERKRIYILKKEYTAEAYPELYDAWGFSTPEGIDDYAQARRAVLLKTLCGLDNVILGDGADDAIDSSKISDPERLVQIMELAGWDERAAMVCMRAQTATPKQRLS